MDAVFFAIRFLLFLQTIGYCRSSVVSRDCLFCLDNPSKKGMVVTNYYVPIPSKQVLDRVFKKEKREFQECAEVLTIKQCKGLTQLVLEVGMPEHSVMDAIADAKLQGASHQKDIYKKALRYLELRMACDMLITEHLCLKILRAAFAKKIAYHEVDDLLQLLVGQGIEDKDVLTQNLIKFIMTGGKKQDNLYQGNMIRDDFLIRTGVKNGNHHVNHEGHEEHHHGNDEGHEEHHHGNHEGHEEHHHGNHEGHEEHHHENHEGHEEHHHENHEGHEEHHHGNHEGHEEHHHGIYGGHENHQSHWHHHHPDNQEKHHDDEHDAKSDDSKDNSISMNHESKDATNIDGKKSQTWNQNEFGDAELKQYEDSERSINKQKTKVTHFLMPRRQIGDRYRLTDSSLQNPEESKTFSDQKQIKATIFDFRKRQIWNQNGFDDDRVSSNQEEKNSDYALPDSDERDARFVQKKSLAPAMWPRGRFGDSSVRSINDDTPTKDLA